MTAENQVKPRRWYHAVLIWLAWRLAALSLILVLLGTAAGFATYFILTPRHFDLAEIEKANRIPGVTYLDASGKFLATRGAYHGDPVDLETLPPYVVEAFLSTEDRRFYRHRGIDPRGLARAIVANLRAGRLVEGGSTITQQLAKNLFLSTDRTMSRKFKEVFFAIWLERHLTKDQILTIYLNRIYMGAGAYGIGAAADFYFDKPVTDVTLAEAAMLAGLPKAPSSLAPTSNLASAQNRARIVLDNMVEARYLKEEEIADAKASPAEVADRAKLGAIQYFLDYVHELVPILIEDTGEDLIIKTTLDTSLQNKAEQAMATAMGWYEPPEGEERKPGEADLLNVGQGALVAYGTDGTIRAMVGGRSYTDSQFNRAVQARRQPGSAFKPFVYLTALEAGYTPDTIVEDAPIKIGNWEPTNYSDSYAGRVTLRQALARSINTVSARLTEAVTPQKVVETAQRLGIDSPLSPVYSISLGTSQVSLLELTGAFVPFATSGLAAPPHAVLEIMSASGDVLYAYEAPADDLRLIDQSTAVDMNDMMFQVMYAGTGRRAALGARPAAGKTGTSQEWRDAWFVGYTADLVAGVWVGNDDDTPMQHVTGGGMPAKIWRDFMLSAHQNKKIAALPGAQPSRDGNQVAELRSFYDELIVDLERMGAGEQPPGPKDTGPPPRDTGCRPKWLPWCN